MIAPSSSASVVARDFSKYSGSQPLDHRFRKGGLTRLRNPLARCFADRKLARLLRRAPEITVKIQWICSHKPYLLQRTAIRPRRLWNA